MENRKYKLVVSASLVEIMTLYFDTTLEIKITETLLKKGYYDRLFCEYYIRNNDNEWFQIMDLDDDESY
ncbi:hypothetical protein CON36_22370 [Bacillus cereus]|uniref:Uncharacterized protein n=1 Tax=Bacillus cereus TaxID=1396 RepID=A0A9X6XX17_BACCE|nr:hypothetical protein [Bacillus cereus]PDZ96542.1 hypothetical protein CON36_22370 [Bacillus cereus]